MNDPKTIDRLSSRPADRALTRWRRSLAALVGNDEIPGRVLTARRDAQTTITTGRRIAFLGLHGGAGTTSTMLAVAQSLAEARGGSVAVGAMWNSPDLHWRHHTGTGEGAVWAHPENISDNPQRIPELSRSRQLFLFDCGGSTEFLPAIAPHVTVLVARRTVRGQHLMNVVRDSWKFPSPTIAALRDVPDSGVEARREGVHLGDLAVIPHDRHIAGEARINRDLFAESTRIAMDELAAQIVRTAVTR